MTPASNATEHAIEALLFALGRPLARAELAAMLGKSEEEVAAALQNLTGRSGGIMVVDDGREAELRAAPDCAALIERVRKEEYNRDIGKAGLEVLSAILYRGPLTRSEVDFIRGVNSAQTMRTLALRGLIRKAERGESAGGRRGTFLYEPTTELLSQLGVSRKEDLPDYAAVRGKLQELEEAYRAQSAPSEHTQP